MWIFIVLSIVLGIVCIVLGNKLKSASAKIKGNEGLESRILDLESRNVKLVDSNNRLADENSRLNDLVDDLNGEKFAWLEEKVELHNAVSQFKTMGRVDDVDQLLAAKIGELDGRGNDLKVVADAYVIVANQVANLNAEKQGVVEEINRLKVDKNTLTNELNGLKVELESVKVSYMSSIKVSEGRGDKVMLVLTESEKRLIELIDTICLNYPSLAVELETVAWRKVWLPKLQEECVNRGWDKKGGIYRLSSVENEGVCYVGQATNFKDRWYQHAKKMIGIESRGGEKLYRDVRRPDMVMWEVVEVVEDSSKFNEREKWWIEFFRAREGWNKKS